MTLAVQSPTAALSLEPVAINQLMPMHLRLDAHGIIRSVGPTLAKLLPASSVLGQTVARVFSLRRPAAPMRMVDLRLRIGSRLHLALCNDPALVLRGLAVPTGDGGLLINLSFGIWVHEAVRRYGLTVADFAATDLTVEMLYLVEAKSAVTDELRNLNLRLQGAKRVAEEQALTDTLTGLRNRRALDQHLGDLADRHQPFGLMHMDLDFFKQVNDTLGHAAGDHVLKEVARILVEETRATDLVARVGGDEFVLVFPRLADPAGLKDIASRIIARLGVPIRFEGQVCRISCSIGMTVFFGQGSPDIDALHARADEALYISKRHGRGRATFYAQPHTDPPPAAEG
jgi:diguanylate cyclase (GGDEF)-like protein